jgi:hypothetical protein
MIYRKSLITVFAILLMFSLTSAKSFEPQNQNGRDFFESGGHKEGISESPLLDYFWPITPSCENPPHSRAYAVFTTGYGSVRVQFHGTTTWSNDTFCDADICTWGAWADMAEGDAIWLYSVQAASAAHILARCDTLAK